MGLASAASGADAALRARDWGEFLKSVSYLASDGVVVASKGDQHSSSFPSSSSSSLSSSSPSSSSFSASSSSLYAPHEADALLLLYFTCVPPQPQSLDVATRLRALAMRRRRGGREREEEQKEKGEEAEEDDRDGNEKPPPPPPPPPPPSRHHPLPSPIGLAVAVHVAVTSGDGLALARLHRGHPASTWRTRALTAPALERGLLRFSSSAAASSSAASSSPSSSSSALAPVPSSPLPVRGGYPAALAALAASYRSLPIAAARRLIGTGSEEGGGGEEGKDGSARLDGLVEAARGRGARWALATTLPLAGGGELKFK